MQDLRHASAALAVFLFPVIASAQISMDIVGGHGVGAKDPIEKTAVALYQEQGNEAMICTATLIAKDMALTAAHCVEDGVDRMQVIFGRDIQANDSQAVRVLRAAVPKQRSQAQGSDRDLGDIAVIQLEGEIPAGYRPANLLPPQYSLTKGEQVILAGYGISDVEAQSGAGELRKTVVTVAQPDFGESEIVFDQSQGSGACHGDSGGPAFVEEQGKLYLLGITNRSYPDAAPDDCQHEVVYTKATAYRQWIARTIRELRSSRD